MPIAGMQHMQARRRSKKSFNQKDSTDCLLTDSSSSSSQQSFIRSLWSLCRGPGCLTQALGIQKSDNCLDLINGRRLWLTEPVNLEKFIDFATIELMEANDNSDPIVCSATTTESAADGFPVKQSKSNLEDYCEQIDMRVAIAECLAQTLHILDVESTKAATRSSPRIGIDYAGMDAKLLYRFFIESDPSVSATTRSGKSKKGKRRDVNEEGRGGSYDCGF